MRKLKARFCVRGNLQVKGVDYFDVYAPLIQWSTVRMMMTMALVMGLKTKQVDYSNAFAQAELRDKEEVYIELLQGFNAPREGDFILKLNKALYGQVVAPQRWFEKLSAALEKAGLKASANDPCLFLGDKVICVVYCDDCLFFAKDDADIEGVVSHLQVPTSDGGSGLELEYENQDVAGFLGLDIKKLDKGRLRFTQTGLINRVLALTGMTECNAKDTPAAQTALGADKDGAPRREGHKWKYAAAIGMLMYLAQNSRPDIAFAVHQCARFLHNPKASHEEAVKRICRYLKGTREEGLIFNTGGDLLQLDCFVDANFAGNWGAEDPEDPVSVKSRTGYVIKLAGCPLIWGSKLQQMIALSSTESEYLALSYSMRSLLPLRALATELLSHLDQKFEGAVIKSTVFEDNNGCIAMAKTKKISPRTKHIATHVHFFKSHIKSDANPDGNIDIQKVDTRIMEADGLTKGLGSVQFKNIRKLLCRW